MGKSRAYPLNHTADLTLPTFATEATLALWSGAEPAEVKNQWLYTLEVLWQVAPALAGFRNAPLS